MEKLNYNKIIDDLHNKKSLIINYICCYKFPI